MKTYEFELTGVSPLMFGRIVSEQKPSVKNYDDWELEIYKKKAHIDDQGQLFIPPFALKNALMAAAVRLNVSVKGSQKLGKFMAQGTLVLDNLVLRNPANNKVLTSEELIPLTLFVPSDGKRGGSRRVNKTFPVVPSWKTSCSVTVLDEIISKKHVRDSIVEAGQFIGFGSMRVEKGGINGRFSVNCLNKCPDRI